MKKLFAAFTGLLVLFVSTAFADDRTTTIAAVLSGREWTRPKNVDG
jgi:hypothetical protein